MKKWNQEELLKKLNEKKSAGIIYQWSLTTEKTNREEAYFIQSEKKDSVEIDQSRSIQEDTTSLRLEIDKGEKLGSAAGRLHHNTDIEEQIESLVQAARLGEEKKWSLGAASPKSETSSSIHQSDPIVWESPQAAMKLFSQNMIQAIQDVGVESFNSSELFISKKKQNLFLSNGFEGERLSSEIYTELCFSATANQDSAEFLLTKSAGSYKQIDFKALCRESLENATAMLKEPRTPPSGNYHVIIDLENLASILIAGLLPQLNGTHKYFGRPFLEKGTEVIPSFDGGDFRLWLDPNVKHAFCSKGFDEYGTLQKKTLLIEKNTVVENLNNRKISSYLKVPETSSVGTIVLEPKNAKNITELQHSKEKVLQILQLSSMEIDSDSLTFSSEIRLAYLHDKKNKSKTVIKGGSISGSFKENFKQVQWCSNQQLFNNIHYGTPLSYYGPSHALLNEVSVSS